MLLPVDIREIVDCLRQDLPGDLSIEVVREGEAIVAIMGATTTTKIVFCKEPDELDELSDEEEILRLVCIRYGADYCVARSRDDMVAALEHWGLA
jgi:hypothetical protein